MKAGIYYGIGHVGIEERDMPAAGPDDVVVKNIRAGICGTDLNAYRFGGESVAIYENEEFGHEMVGVVHEVGTNIKDIKVGDRVFVNPAACKKEGILKTDTAGAFSEYVCVENARWGYNLFKLDDSLSFDEAVVAEPFCVGTHGQKQAGVTEKDHVVIYGAGTIGLCALCSVVASGNKTAAVVDNNPVRLKMAEDLGGIPVNFAEGNVQEKLKTIFGKTWSMTGAEVADVDAVIDCAGASNILSDAVMYSKRGSRVSCLATAQNPVTLYPALIMSSEITIKGSCGYTIDDIQDVIGLLNSHQTDVHKIVTHHFPIEKLSEAFAFANDPKNNSIKVVIDF